MADGLEIQGFCGDCKLGQANAPILQGAWDMLGVAEESVGDMIDAAAKMAQLKASGELPPAPDIDQKEAYTLEATPLLGGVVLDIVSKKAAISEILEGPECSPEARQASPSGCPKSDRMLPLLGEVMQLITSIPDHIKKGIGGTDNG